MSTDAARPLRCRACQRLSLLFHGHTFKHDRPGGSDTLNIRNILLNAPDICSKARHLLFAADNAQHTHDTIRPALATGSDVLLDRCIGSAYAYQGWGEGFGMERVRISYDWATDNFKPDLTVFFDMNPVEVITRREINDEQIEEDVIEKFGIDFQWRVYEGYHSLVDHEDGWVCIRTPPTLTIVENNRVACRRYQRAVIRLKIC